MDCAFALTSCSLAFTKVFNVSSSNFYFFLIKPNFLLVALQLVLKIIYPLSSCNVGGFLYILLRHLITQKKSWYAEHIDILVY